MFVINFILIFFLASCIMLQGSRFTETEVLSEPPGAEIYIVHETKAQNYLYQDKPKFTKDDQILSLLGVTPLKIKVPRNTKNRIIATKEGFEDGNLVLSTTMPPAYYEDKNKPCFQDRYMSWLYAPAISDEILAERLHGGILKEFCNDARPSYTIKLKEFQTQ